MIPALSLDNFISWFIQVAVISLAGAALPKLLRVRHPRSYLAWCYIILALCLVVPWLQPWQTSVAPAAISAIAGPSQPQLSAAESLSWLQVALLVLAGGILTKLGFFLAGMLRLRHYRRSAVPLNFPKESVLSICKLLNRRVEIGVSAHEIGPVTLGWLRPIVLLPDSFMSLEEDEQQAILCHELLHVTRNDWLANIAEELIGAVLWFHPGIWWLLSQTKLAREQVVDAEVIRLTAAREPYIEALLAMAGAHPDRCLSPAPSFLRQRQLAERMRLLLLDKPASGLRVTLSYSATLAALTLLSASTVAVFPLLGEAVPFTSAAVPGVEQPLPSVIYSQADGVVMPRVLAHVAPHYSDAARQAGLQGTVLLEGVVLTNGVMTGLKVARPLDSELDHNAIYALKQWRFEPGRLNGVPVPVRLLVETHFSLK